MDIALLCLLMWISFAWISFGHREQMGADRADRPQDRWITPSRMNRWLAIGALVHALFCYRRIAIALGSSQILFADPLALPSDHQWAGVGGLIFLVGMAVRVWAIRTLGRLFTFQIGIRQNHRIVDQGPYRWLRHPSYTGFFLMIVGLGISYASGTLLVLTLPTTIGFLVLRIRDEESMLQKHFGEPYLVYSRRTKRLIPLIY